MLPVDDMDEPLVMESIDDFLLGRPLDGDSSLEELTSLITLDVILLSNYVEASTIFLLGLGDGTGVDYFGEARGIIFISSGMCNCCGFAFWTFLNLPLAFAPEKARGLLSVSFGDSTF